MRTCGRMYTVIPEKKIAKTDGQFCPIVELKTLSTIGQNKPLFSCHKYTLINFPSIIKHWLSFATHWLKQISSPRTFS